MSINVGKKSISILTLCLLLLCVPVFAGGGNGTGGGGGNAPLTLESSNPESGAVDISTEGKIEMTFSNNVVNMKVSENNMTCFKLLDNEGKEVAIDVIMGDDQVDPTIKNDITVQSKAALEENKSYKLVISPELTAKNGSKLGAETVIDFTTLSAQSTEPVQSSEATQPAEPAESTEPAESAETDESTQSNTPMMIFGIIVVLGIVGVAITRKNKK
ncbi:Ig-like domain-containing domain [Fusibacter ferrireducens]|uniref:Ig-like domain-containing protein n=1 Tax=Fusibacter ferrireducens TaxID=2785058 RepID=A0ABR9ZPH9_9FIRM|nr:Ig-like domain-containing protein [Fusibacter ferrireducens]MBF4692377.1 Ig-like domain-containing protein [Fusibacter ferrireducens]